MTRETGTRHLPLTEQRQIPLRITRDGPRVSPDCFTPHEIRDDLEWIVEGALTEQFCALPGAGKAQDLAGETRARALTPPDLSSRRPADSGTLVRAQRKRGRSLQTGTSRQRTTGGPQNMTALPAANPKGSSADADHPWRQQLPGAGRRRVMPRLSVLGVEPGHGAPEDRGEL